jgi:parallel beta-helix repeat protein
LKSWIIIDGFKITGAVNEGVRFNGNLYSDIIIRNCIVYSNGREGITISEVDKIAIENCLVYNNTGMGIKTVGAVNGLKVSNCTVYGNSRGLHLLGDGTVRDCIVTNNPVGIYGNTSHIVTYCDVYGNTTNYSGTVTAGAGCISADPLFVNPGTDFHLLPASPCIGTASDSNDMGYRY